jgi:transposase, IS6 family
VRFFKKVLKARHNKQPRVINVDKNPAYPPAIEELKKAGILSNECELRQNKYLNNIIEQDHRFPWSRFEWEVSHSKADLKS